MCLRVNERETEHMRVQVLDFFWILPCTTYEGGAQLYSRNPENVAETYNLSRFV